MSDEKKDGQPSAGEAKPVDLSEADLSQVTGGVLAGGLHASFQVAQQVVSSKAKTADKAFEAIDKYIRS